MFKKILRSSLFLSLSLLLFSASGYSDCEPECTHICRSFPPFCQNIWASYTYFYLNDERDDGLGTAHADNELLGFNYYFLPCVSFGLYGIHENSRNTSRIEGATALLPGRRNLSHAEGWGGGFHLNYDVTCTLSTYLDWSYVSIHQGLTTQDLSLLLGDTVAGMTGYRWNLAGGLILVYPLECVTISGNLNYLFIFNHMGGLVDSLAQELTGQNARLGIGNLSSQVFFLPWLAINPFIGGGIAYDLNRSNDFPIFTSISGSSVSTFPLRDRFEWNIGAGILWSKDFISLSISYLHRQRSGPIKTDILACYASIFF